MRQLGRFLFPKSKANSIFLHTLLLGGTLGSELLLVDKTSASQQYRLSGWAETIGSHRVTVQYVCVSTWMHPFVSYLQSATLLSSLHNEVRMIHATHRHIL